MCNLKVVHRRGIRERELLYLGFSVFCECWYVLVIKDPPVCVIYGHDCNNSTDALRKQKTEGKNK